ncbi:aspartate--tRNA(Asn) ligase [archaeon]|jgi:nondiscriminating aspartyl-tRNA synthetase|nr:aspartate--tRNA(Asn) ligase [archaeon]MBT3451502.1 aspartate--tRNA(Asn) ligase [archaeon]MBT6869495.1 aspartate--tRNA(Asn) ligase [archaeon]MBT7193183.1 aspartate--tRNA(Asn) ligase [archaeon]MBT7380489.1 aspartate--tRNA(Asn) ligase [archaeon]
MARTLIKELSDKVGEEVLIKGWVQEIRNLNKIKFIILRDRSGDMQTIALKSKTDENSFDLINDITKESVVDITGLVKENKESRWGIEVVISKVELVSKSEVPLPIDNTNKSNTNIDKRIDFRFLDTRNIKTQSIFKIRSKIVKILTNFFDDNGFTNMNTPKITTLGVESGAELFEVNYFGRKIFLSQSPQIYKQMFVAGGFERVYEIAPVFRAEKSHTTRHVTEFTGVDMEMGFIKDENEIMDMIEKMFIDLLSKLKEEAKSDLEKFGVEILVPEKIPRITMAEAKKMLAEKGKVFAEEDDLDAEGEKMFGDIVKEQFGSEFVFITKFPWEVRPFYHMKPEGEEHSTKSFDLLFNGVEICTGAQREHRYEILKAQAKSKGLNLDDMEKYGEIFRFGVPPHGGVGFGLDRITQRLLKLENIREAILLPRDPERMSP